MLVSTDHLHCLAPKKSLITDVALLASHTAVSNLKAKLHTTPANSTCCGGLSTQRRKRVKNPPDPHSHMAKTQTSAIDENRGMSWDPRRRWEDKKLHISMQAASKELLQKRRCYVNQTFPVLLLQLFKTGGHFLLRRAFSSPLTILGLPVQLEYLCALSRDQLRGEGRHRAPEFKPCWCIFLRDFWTQKPQLWLHICYVVLSYYGYKA